MPRLPHDRVDDIKSGNFVFWFTFQDELFNILNDMFVELDGFHRCLRDCSHFGLRNRDLVVVQREELEICEKLDLKSFSNSRLTHSSLTLIGQYFNLFNHNYNSQKPKSLWNFQFFDAIHLICEVENGLRVCVLCIHLYPKILSL